MPLCNACAGSALLTLQDAATLLACSPDWLRRAVHDGRVKARRVGNRLRFNRDELLASLPVDGVIDGCTP